MKKQIKSFLNFFFITSGIVFWILNLVALSSITITTTKPVDIQGSDIQSSTYGTIITTGAEATLGMGGDGVTVSPVPTHPNKTILDRLDALDGGVGYRAGGGYGDDDGCVFPPTRDQCRVVEFEEICDSFDAGGSSNNQYAN